MKNNYKIYFVFIIIIYLYSLPKYVSYLPTIPIYNNNEANDVLKISKNRTAEDIDFFNLTDESIVSCFLPYVVEDKYILRKLITTPLVYIIVYSLKYIINRPRPYQINNNINNLYSSTGNTPSLPAGHAFQAYYLAHILSNKYPNNKELFNYLAEKCNHVRIAAGIHYPSDGILSKKIVNLLIDLKII